MSHFVYTPSVRSPRGSTSLLQTQSLAIAKVLGCGHDLQNDRLLWLDVASDYADHHVVYVMLRLVYIGEAWQVD